jgi:hypothetical protein
MIRIKIPFAQAFKLVSDLVRFIPHGVTLEEGHQLAQDLLALAMPLLHQAGGNALPVEMVLGEIAKDINAG